MSQVSGASLYEHSVAGKDDGFPRVLTALVVILVVIGDLFTWIAFSTVCVLSEEPSHRTEVLCDLRIWGWSLIGALAVIVGGVLAWKRRQAKPLLVGAVIGVVLGGAAWLIGGDPAGNFGPVIG